MSDQLSIGGTSTRRRIGPTRRQVDVTLLAWRKAGIVAGDEFAALRSALRDAADAVDGTRGAYRMALGVAPDTVSAADDLSRLANRHGESARRLAELLALARPEGVSGDGDAFGAFLAGLSVPTVRD